ncbi:type II secretion system F family protein [Candidatus Pacearchaeota archaeon]|nr:type II secretion system F family protein [Candidatus Pacearchaeota archaeon]
MAPLIQIGEESGELPEIMAKGADLIKRDCDFRVDYLDRINSPTLAKQRFFDYTATLVEAGYPLMRTLSKLENFPAFQGGLANAIGATIGSFATGSTFAEALARHPEYFDKFDVNMVKAGEVGGVLDQTLIRAAHYYSEKYSAEAKKGLIGRVVDAFRGN